MKQKLRLLLRSKLLLISSLPPSSSTAASLLLTGRHLRMCVYVCVCERASRFIIVCTYTLTTGKDCTHAHTHPHAPALTSLRAFLSACVDVFVEGNG